MSAQAFLRNPWEGFCLPKRSTSLGLELGLYQSLIASSLLGFYSLLPVIHFKAHRRLLVLLTSFSTITPMLLTGLPPLGCLHDAPMSCFVRPGHAQSTYFSSALDLSRCPWLFSHSYLQNKNKQTKNPSSQLQNCHFSGFFAVLSFIKRNLTN